LNLQGYHGGVSVLLQTRGWGEYRHYDEAAGARIADRMHYAGWGEGCVATRQVLRFFADRHNAGSFKDYVEFVLPFVSVRGVFLTWLEAVQPGEEEIALRNGGLAHPVW
jgi:hypothetical protein